MVYTTSPPRRRGGRPLALPMLCPGLYPMLWTSPLSPSFLPGPPDAFVCCRSWVLQVVKSPRPQDTIRTEDLPDEFSWADQDGVSMVTKNLNQHIPQCKQAGAALLPAPRLLNPEPCTDTHAHRSALR